MPRARIPLPLPLLLLPTLLYTEYPQKRTARAVTTLLTISSAYKILPTTPELHTYAARKILECCRKNGGLYVKFGQSIASLNAIVPKEYIEELGGLQEDAERMRKEEVEEAMRKGLGEDWRERFQHFEEYAVGAASIAQVHKATLKDGTEVAVKVQNPNIQKQFAVDMFLHKCILHVIEWAFELPIAWTHETIQRHLQMETDFLNEARNGEICKAVNAENDDVYIPKIYAEHTTSTILTAEWIDGVKITQMKKWSPDWKSKDVMNKVVNFFGRQIFVTGFIHCDPHPGNLFLRANPARLSEPQLVVLDHGLYLTCPQAFRKEYCTLWEAMFLRDIELLKSISARWGFKDPTFLATIQLQKPFNPHDVRELTTEEKQEVQRKLKERARNFLAHSTNIPEELVLVMRNMNIIRALNRELGTPVDRIGLMALWASKGLRSDADLSSYTHFERSHFYSDVRPFSLEPIVGGSDWHWRLLKFRFQIWFVLSIFWLGQKLRIRQLRDFLESRIEGVGGQGAKESFGEDLG